MQTKEILSLLVSIAAPLALFGCGSPQQASQTASAVSCGGESATHPDDGAGGGPIGNDWTGVYLGAYNAHDLHVDLARDGMTAQMLVDQTKTLDLRIVARLYCSDSVGMYGDGATRQTSKVLVTLFRTESNARSIKVGRWDL